MPKTAPDPIFDAFAKARARGILPTSLDTAGIRELAAEVRLSSAFTANGTSKIFVQGIKDVLDELTGDQINHATAVAKLHELIHALGYTPEGGFPTLPGDAVGAVEPALKGTLQDLSSFRRLTLIVKTQTDLMTGAGLKYRGTTPDRLRVAPAWELVRVLPVAAPRDWPSRWTIAGGKIYPHSGGHGALYSETGMIALKGDPIWGELGSSGNFSDALDVDHPPFAFNSGMGWLEVSRARCLALGVRGPNGETIDEFFKSQPATLSGRQPLPTPAISMRDVDPELVDAFKRETGAVETPGKPGLLTLPRMTPEERAKAALERRALQKAGGGQ